MNDRLRQFIVVFFAIAQAVVGYLSNAWLSPNVGEVSNSFESNFTPAGITFSVWGYLYLALIAYALYQVLPGQRERTLHRRVGWWVALGCAASTLWPVVFSWVGQLGTPAFQIGPLWISVLLIVLLLGSLMLSAWQLRARHHAMTSADIWLVTLPVMSYLAWAAVATIANVTVLLIGLGWSFARSPLWSVAMIGLVTLLGLAVIYAWRSRLGLFAFAAVLLWAGAGIYAGNNAESSLVGITALVAMAVIALFYAWRFMAQPSTADQPASDQRSRSAQA